MKLNLKAKHAASIQRILSISCGIALTVTCSSSLVFSQEKLQDTSDQKPSNVRPFSFMPASNSKATNEIIRSTADAVFAKIGAPKPIVDRKRPEKFPAVLEVGTLESKSKTTAIFESSAGSVMARIEDVTARSLDPAPTIPEPAKAAELEVVVDPPSVPTPAKLPESRRAGDSAEVKTPVEVVAQEVAEIAEAPSETLPEANVSGSESPSGKFNTSALAGEHPALKNGEGRGVGYAAPTPVQSILHSVTSRLRGEEGVNAVGHFSLLSLSRDYRGNGRALSSGIPNLFANGPDEGDFTGFDVGYGRRRGGGKGWEMRFLSFNPDEAVDVAGSRPTLVWAGVTDPLVNPNTPEFAGLSGIGIGADSMADIFDDSFNHRVIRDSQFGSFEFNLLRAGVGGERFRCGNSMVEFTGGLRAVSFEESISLVAGATSTAGFPSTAAYLSEVENHLFGLQIGARMERQLNKGWGYTFGTKVGIYNNRVTGRQRAEYRFDDGSIATPQVLVGADAGRSFDFTGTDNELAFLGELDLGIIYQFSQRARARVGYRGIAVTNIAAAASQLENNLFDIGAVAEPTAFDDLIVGGLYFGVDYGF